MTRTGARGESTVLLHRETDLHADSLCSYAVYSSLSPGFQKYLEGLTALHSAVAQADGARAAGLPVRRDPIETIHPVVRVHPVTGWKSVYVNHGEASFRLPAHPLSPSSPHLSPCLAHPVNLRSPR